MSERNTFSPFWHRVRALRPRLRPHVQITRQHYRGKRWHVVHDPSANNFYRVSHVGHQFVAMLDGRRTVEEAWELGLSRYGDDALTQNDVIQLLSQLHSSNLLSADVAPETEQLLNRGRDRRQKKFKAQAIGLMYFKVRLFNPDQVLAWLLPIFRPLLSRFGLALWAAWVIAAIVALAPHWERLYSGVGSAIAPSNWGFMIAGFVLLKLIHEAGHGLLVKRFGGQCPELGAMMLVLLPAPYVDASAAWGFENKWKRIAVGAGGMVFELAIAAAAAFVWLRTPDGSLAHQLAFNAIFTAGVSTVLFNANPLMKFDGYYILSDLIEVPNLMQRSNQMLLFICQKAIYRVRNPIAPTSDPREALILIVFGSLSLAYRVFLFISITLYVMGMMFAIGLLLAIWTGAMWFILPFGKLVHWLATSSGLHENRGRAVVVTILLAALGLGALGLVPAPDRRRAVGVVESADEAGVFFEAEGIVEEVLVRDGDRVTKGQVLARGRSDELESQAMYIRAQLAELESKQREALRTNLAAAQVAQEYLGAIQSQLALIEKRIAGLTMRAPRDGVVVGLDADELLGSLVRIGQPLCTILEPGNVRVTAILSQTEADWLSTLTPSQYAVQMRTISHPGTLIEARTSRVVEAASRELPHSAFTFAGGGTVAPDQQDRTGLLAADRYFRAEFVPTFVAAGVDGAPQLAYAEGLGSLGVPGERVTLRFSLPWQPLMTQWLDQLRKATQGRAKL
jgi:putative peptide zinc metalloprotease protein